MVLLNCILLVFNLVFLLIFVRDNYKPSQLFWPMLGITFSLLGLMSV